jgi:hypothetical protein
VIVGVSVVKEKVVVGVVVVVVVVVVSFETLLSPSSQSVVVVVGVTTCQARGTSIQQEASVVDTSPSIDEWGRYLPRERTNDRYSMTCMKGEGDRQNCLYMYIQFTSKVVSHRSVYAYSSTL